MAEAQESKLVVTDPTGHPLSAAQEARVGNDGSGFGIMDTSITKIEPRSRWMPWRRPRVKCAVIATVCRRGNVIEIATTAEFAEAVARLRRYLGCTGADTSAIHETRCLTHWWGPMPR